MPKPLSINSRGHYINGQWVKGIGPALNSINPSDGSVIWEGTHSSSSEVSAAYDAAQNAFSSWAWLDFDTRAQYAKKFAAHIETKRDQLTHLIALETGKPLWEAATEVTSVIGKINLSIQAYQERTGTKIVKQEDVSSCLRFKPQGVVVVLGPYNFPAHISNGHIIPALLAGNTILYKPSELTPAVAEWIIECWDECQLPPGVLNCLQGGADLGKELLSQDIQGVYFTGSYATGLAIHQQFSAHPETILALEMGGNNPLVIDEIKDVKAGVYHTVLSTLLTAGQRCTCARRLMIPDTPQGDNFLTHLIQACHKIKIGSFDQQPEPFMGPVISYAQALNHLKSQQELARLGGDIILPMTLLVENTGFLSPSIIDMSSVMHPSDQEIFGPLIQIYRYTDFDEAIHLANQTRYGLSAGLLSDKEQHYLKFYQHVKAGLINWNKPTTGAASTLPFGGVGISGNHRPSAYFAADYCAYPVASMEHHRLALPNQRVPGFD